MSYFRLLSALLLLAVIGFFYSPAEAQNPPPKRLTIQGEQILDDQGRIIHLRGANLQGIEEAQANEIANELKFNFVRLRISFEPPNLNAAGDGFTEEYKAAIHKWITLLSERGIWINIEMRGNDELTNSDEFYMIGSPTFNRYLNAWMYLANTYKDTDYIAAYGLLAEPSVNHTKIEGTVKALTNFQKALMDKISTVDSRTPFIVGPDWNYDTLQYRFDDYYTNLASYRGRLIYVVNVLTPKDWIRDGSWTIDSTKPTYPLRAKYTEEELGQLLADSGFSRKGKKSGLPLNVPLEKRYNEMYVKDGFYQMTLTPTFIRWYLKYPRVFKARHQVPMLVDQFGASTESNGQLAYENDLIDAFETYGFGWCRWAYNAGSGSRKIIGNPTVKNFYVKKMDELLAQQTAQ